MRHGTPRIPSFCQTAWLTLHTALTLDEYAQGKGESSRKPMQTIYCLACEEHLQEEGSDPAGQQPELPAEGLLPVEPLSRQCFRPGPDRQCPACQGSSMMYWPWSTKLHLQHTLPHSGAHTCNTFHTSWGRLGVMVCVSSGAAPPVTQRKRHAAVSSALASGGQETECSYIANRQSCDQSCEPATNL